jgi:hypothetical protein
VAKKQLIFEHSGAALPYSIRERSGAETLLVVFPVLRRGVRPPPYGMRRYFEGARVHMLMVGTDEHTLIGPKGSLAGSRAAVALIDRERERLGLTHRQVVTGGISGAGTLATIVGLMHGSGRVIAGAPPLRPGAFLQHWYEGRGKLQSKTAKQEADWFLALAPGEGDERAAFLDELVFRLAPECPRETELVFMTSLMDYARPSVEEFEAFAASIPQLTVRIVLRHFGRHQDNGDAYFRLLRESVTAEAR